MRDFLGAFFIPTERPPTLLDVKRALLTFDHVHLPAPDDREFVAPDEFTLFTNPALRLLPFKFAGGPVLPLGKVRGYDDAFEELRSSLRPAISDGSIVEGKAPVLMQNAWGIGAVRSSQPEGWGDATFVIENLRRLLTDETLLRDAARGIGEVGDLINADLDALAPASAFLEAFPDGARLTVDGDRSVPPEVEAAATRLAAARLGAVVKGIGMSEVQGLFPLASTGATALLLDEINARAVENLAQILADEGEDEKLFRRTMRAERVVFNEVGSELALATMSVEDVLRLRTGANWRGASSARAAFFAAVRRFSEETATDSDFDRAVRDAIADYAKTASDGWHELKQAGLGVAIPAMGTVVADGILAKLLALPSWQFTVAFAAIVGGLAAVRREGVDAYRDFMKTKKHPGKALIGAIPKPLRR